MDPASNTFSNEVDAKPHDILLPPLFPLSTLVALHNYSNLCVSLLLLSFIRIVSCIVLFCLTQATERFPLVEWHILAPLL